jgi:hypothetical protein
MHTSPKTTVGSNKPQTGFSLIITVTMLILLSLIAVGLLSLSSVVLRSSKSDSAMTEARANARLALNMAVASLQKHAGPDTRVTARAEVVSDSLANPYLTGVWESEPLDPDSPPSSGEFSENGKEEQLLSWLASGAPDDGRVTNQFVRSTLEDPVTLWGEGSLGRQVSDRDMIAATRVPLSNYEQGSIAWAVVDEGVKARINTGTKEPGTSATARFSQLGSGLRPASELIDGLEGFRSDDFEEGSEAMKQFERSATLGSFGLASASVGGTVAEDVKELFHDITPFSRGVLSDTANGGLKTDFNLFTSQQLSNGALPELYSHFDDEYVNINGENVYQTLLDLKTEASPSWRSFFQFGRLHEDQVIQSNRSPKVVSTVPDGWEAANTVRLPGRRIGLQMNEEPPEELVLMPTIAKVQMIFSLVGRDIYRQNRYSPGAAPLAPNRSPNMHNPQAGHFKRTRFGYDLHLLYTPVVVLHNPYSVALEFRDMKVEFHHVPFSLQIFRNGSAQSQDLVPFETMFDDNDTEGRNKVFGMNLKTSRRGRPSSSTFEMMPGEVILFSPYIDPNLTWYDNFDGGRSNWDIYVGDNKTANLDSMPGWRGDGLGYDCDWLAGAFRIDGNAQSGRWNSCFGLAADDEIHAEFSPHTTLSSDNKFFVTMKGTPQGSGSQRIVNAIEIDYGSSENLRSTILGSPEGTLRYPEEGTISGRDLIDWGGSPIKDMQNVKPIAVLSLQAKTTNGGLETGVSSQLGGSQIDGRVAAKPWSFAHGSIGASSANLTLEHPSAHSHEIDLQALTLAEGTSTIIEVDGDRGNFITGHSSFNGLKFGVAYEIPITPLQSLSTLNGANPGGASSFLPRFAAPIGNSWAHPLLDEDGIQQSSSRNYQMWDHSYLLNAALYDRFYFSGLGSQRGPFGNGDRVSDSISRFVEEGSLEDQRLKLYQPDGRSARELEEISEQRESHEKIAAWQMMEGAFNINSTSVEAWKAMLASIKAPEAEINELSPSNRSSSFDKLDDGDPRGARFSRFRIPLSQSIENARLEELAYWLGPRELKEDELQILAEEIVKQVKLRGPFLTMGEFVNRQLGTGDLSQKGALQAAIDHADAQTGFNSDIGEAALAGYLIDDRRVSGYNYANPDAAIGSSFQGAPGYLTQADVLTALGNAATPRSDTFTVRGYGDSRDKAGRVLASAYCEAVVQRFPEWIDDRDLAESKPGELVSEANRKFGRRFRVVSFRWLSENEV